MTDVTRRRFNQLAATASLAQILPGASGDFSGSTPDKRTFRFAVIADTHIIDDFYRGPEGIVPEDNSSILLTASNLIAARSVINAIDPPVDLTFLVGDYFHNYPSAHIDFYYNTKTRLDNARALTEGFRMPVHVGFGNHDYGVPLVSRESSHQLFKDKFKLEPYYSIDYRGYRFVHLNNFMGYTWDLRHPQYDQGLGSLGEPQLLWLESQLIARIPTFIFIHYPLSIVSGSEFRDLGLYALLRKYKDHIQFVFSGHWHKWIDFARTFGPPHWVVGSTRYDPNAYLIIEVDSKDQSFRFLNQDLLAWGTHYSQPYTGHWS